MRGKPKVLQGGWELQDLMQEVRLFLRLPVAERYRQMVELSAFVESLWQNSPGAKVLEDEIALVGGRPPEIVQVLKPTSRQVSRHRRARRHRARHPTHNPRH